MNPWFSKNYFSFVLKMKNKNLCLIFHFSHSLFRVLKKSHVLKLAKVTPIYKSGDKTECGNYRPISVIPAVTKLFEKLVY